MFSHSPTHKKPSIEKSSNQTDGHFNHDITLPPIFKLQTFIRLRRQDPPDIQVCQELKRSINSQREPISEPPLATIGTMFGLALGNAPLDLSYSENGQASYDRLGTERARLPSSGRTAYSPSAFATVRTFQAHLSI